MTDFAGPLRLQPQPTTPLTRIGTCFSDVDRMAVSSSAITRASSPGFTFASCCISSPFLVVINGSWASDDRKSQQPSLSDNPLQKRQGWLGRTFPQTGIWVLGLPGRELRAALSWPVATALSSERAKHFNVTSGAEMGVVFGIVVSGGDWNRLEQGPLGFSDEGSCELQEPCIENENEMS